jgi:Uma2 family endonuclease
MHRTTGRPGRPGRRPSEEVTMSAQSIEPTPFEDRWATLSHLDNDPALEGWRAELIDGEISLTPPPLPDHERIITDTIKQIVIEEHTRHLDITFWAGGSGLRLGLGVGVKPDIIITGQDAFAEPVEYSNPAGEPIHLVVEVTSSSTRAKDYGEKMRAYAAAKIPNYLIIDRQEGICRLYCLDDTTKAAYGPPTAIAPFGKPLGLPAPLGFELDTTRFA